MSQAKKMGSVGGISATATPGGYNQGSMFAASRGRSDSSGVTQPDLRQSNCCGSAPSAAAKGGYSQGDMMAAKKGQDRPSSEGGDGASLKVSQSDLRGGNSSSGSYNQGSTVTARKK